MRRLIAIILFLLGVSLSERVNVASDDSMPSAEVVDLHREQLRCNHRFNVDAEQTTSVVLPAVRSVVSGTSRQAQQRTAYLHAVEYARTIINYPVIRFIHRLGSCDRAVDYYLYILCRLRL